MSRPKKNIIRRELYPKPDHRFSDAKVGLTYRESEPDFPAPDTAPPGAPNVVLALLDDVGYGWPSATGGLVPMPTADRLAAGGLTYCQFHTTGLCAPTRIALLTGRNHHTVSTGVVQEMATGYPGYSGIRPKSCATIAQLLSPNGYATGWWGKNHNTPDSHTSAAGPFTHWPTSIGFDYFYGFMGGETDQFYPALVRNTTPVSAPASPEDGYHITSDLADDCIAWMRTQKAIAPDRPFFVHFAPGGAHGPISRPSNGGGATRSALTSAGIAIESSCTPDSSSSASSRRAPGRRSAPPRSRAGMISAPMSSGSFGGRSRTSRTSCSTRTSRWAAS